MMALAAQAPCRVIGDGALIHDRPGFEVELLTRGSIESTPIRTVQHEVLMALRGHWKVSLDGMQTSLSPGDTMSVLPGSELALEPSMSGETSLYRVRSTTDPAGPSHHT